MHEAKEFSGFFRHSVYRNTFTTLAQSAGHYGGVEAAFNLTLQLKQAQQDLAKQRHFKKAK